MNSNQDLVQRNRVLERRWKVLLVLAILFLVTRPLALWIVNSVQDKAVQDATKNEYPLIDPVRQLIDQKYFLTTIQPIREKLKELVTNQEKTSQLKITLYLEDLNTGSNVSINQETRVFPASLTKLPVAIVAMGKVARGEWTDQTEITLEDKDKDSNRGELYKLPAGSRLTVSDLIRLALEKSDNTAHVMLLKNLKSEEIQEYWEAIGLEDVFNEAGELSAKEYSRIFRSLYTASYLDRESSNRILNYLVNADFKNYLNTGVPDNVKFAHKYGRSAEEFVYSDAGIIYLDNHPYMITVLTQGEKAEDEAKVIEFMKQVSKESYKFFHESVK